MDDADPWLLSQVRLAYEQGLLKGDLHQIGRLCLMLSLFLEDKLQFERAKLAAECAIGGVFGGGGEPVSDEGNESFDPEEFRAAMAQLQQEAPKDEGWV